MTAYLIRKIFYGLTVLWGVVTLVFVIFSLKPGDPAQMLLGERATPEAIAAVKKELGLDLPTSQQYLIYLNDLSPVSVHSLNEESSFFYDPVKYEGHALNLGGQALVVKAPYLRRSYRSKRMVFDIIKEAIPGTFILATSAILFAIVIGVIVGMISAVRKDSLFDKGSLVIAVLGMSSPSFYMAILISWLGGFVWYQYIHLPYLPFVLALFAGMVAVFKRRGGAKFVLPLAPAVKAFLLGWGLLLISVLIDKVIGTQSYSFLNAGFRIPGTGLEQSGSLYELDVFDGPYLSLKNLILPMITLGIRPLAIIIQLMRNALLEELSKDYIRTARAKGLSDRAVVLRHAFRNALNPLVTAVSGWFASLLAGAVFVEFIFGWQGLGLRVFEALVQEDFPVVIGSVIVISSIFVLINILVDILYGVIDPRVRIGAES